MKHKIRMFFDKVFCIAMIIGIHMMSASVIAWLIGASGAWWTISIVGSILVASGIFYANWGEL